MNGKTGLTIGKRLALGFGVVLAMIVVLTVVGIQKVNFIDDTLEEVTEVNAVKQRYAINFRGSVHDRAIALRDVVLVDPAELQPVIQQIDRLADFYAKSAGPLDEVIASGEAVTADEKAVLTEIKAIEARTLPIIQRVIAAKQAGNVAEAQAVLLREARPAFVEWLAQINKLIDIEEAKNQQATPSARAVASGFQQLMIVLCGLAILIGASVAFFITRGLTRSLGGEPNEAADVIARIAGGDLSCRIQSNYPDSMLSAVAQMQEKLKAIVTGIASSSGELTQRARVVAAASQDARQAAQRQADSSSATVARIEEMTVSINDVSSIARQTEDNSAMTAELSEKGSEAVRVAATEIDRIAQTVTSSAEQIRQLQQRSQDIGGIAGVIREIADQTNLLALNAAIEAARAGETGRGFAVVADEVRKLAERTGSATSEIARMIEVIQNETQTAVSAMETAVPQVENGLALAREATAVLEQIHTQALDSLAKVRDVSQAAARQVTTISDIAANVGDIARMSEDTSASMLNNASATVELEGIAEALRRNVSHFRVA
ncbi:MAG: methyl-accepting chemotaxis protein [Methylophilaceae bacterium]|jgi:methyl-accepting chemotaxis protein|nr:methyl-accepting chemotaxis protein [Methylophilaceae bacterium]